MSRSGAVITGLATFIVGTALCVAIFAALEVKMLFLVGPLIGVGAASFAAYRTAAQVSGP